MKHVVITPAHNEEEHLPALIASVVAQSATPTQWLIVDDHSCDSTRAIATEAAQRYPWIQVLDYNEVGGTARALGSKVARIVLWALEHAEDNWEFLSKLDADIILPPNYYASIFDRFAQTSSLGIASGTCAIRVGDQLKIEHVPRDHTRGPIKTYRRGCWEAMGGFPPTHGWDGIDNLRAQRLGFHTASFADLVAEHQRPTGAARGLLRGRFVTGTFAHFLGYHPLFMVARSVRRMVDSPRVSGGAAMLAGYLYARAAGKPIFNEPETIAYLRYKQLKRLGLGALARKAHVRSRP